MAADDFLDMEDDFNESLGDDDFLDMDEDFNEMEDDEVDLSAVGFPEITKRFESTPHAFFKDPGYYKAALADEGESSKRMHSILQKYLKATDPKDRSVFRPQVMSAYWELLRNVSRKASGKIPEPKKFMLRFNFLHPNFLKSETKDYFAKLVIENELNQPVYYVDEWLKAVGNGTITASTTDEVQVSRGNNQAKMRQQLEKARGKLDGSRALIKAKDNERRELEDSLQNQIKIITVQHSMTDIDDVRACYDESQKRAIVDVQDTLKGMLKCDRELATMFRENKNAEEDVRLMQEKIDSGEDENEVDLQAINSEFNTIRQVAKMTVGRQGNHYPILTNEYFHCGPNDVGFRENVLAMLDKIEKIDPEVYCRYYKNRLNRIVPYVILIPTYGDMGICWEPYNKHNRATSRGRIVIPMYPRNLYVAVLSAVADLRWQVAKEKASYHWMEEGLTGRYYQWYLSQKLKGNIKDYFIQDYIIWMTKEAEGIQKLEKDVRMAFWRYMPFAQDLKEKLRTRSYTYQDLYQRDLNRAMSDGY